MNNVCKFDGLLIIEKQRNIRNNEISLIYAFNMNRENCRKTILFNRSHKRVVIVH